jgi:hypothetical protein
MADEDASMMVNILRILRREVAEGFESLREDHKRTHEAIERLAMDHDDTKQHVAALEHAARLRTARK